MYEKFTDRARKVMQLANQEAQCFNHGYIGTEHILLGIAKEWTGVASNVLKTFGIIPWRIQLEVECLLRHGPDVVTMGRLPQTPGAKKVIEIAIQEASTEFQHNYVGTEHMLLGLISVYDSVAYTVLHMLGLTREKIVAAIREILGHKAEPKAPPTNYKFPRRCVELSHQYSRQCMCWNIGISEKGRPFAILEDLKSAGDLASRPTELRVRYLDEAYHIEFEAV